MAKGISAAQLEQFQQSAAEVLAGPGESEIIEPMLPQCRVCVLIPVYDETVEMLQRPLQSLKEQRRVNFDDFEAVVVVNNNRDEARNKTRAFLANQKTIKFLRKFESGGMHVRLIDKSSLRLADEHNHVAHARNRGCLEAAWRFCQNGRGARGIIAMTDADCRLSPDYVSSLIRIFGSHKNINGISGAIEHEIDQNLPHYKEVQVAFDAHAGFSGRLSPAAKYKNGLALKKRDRLKYSPLNTGQDLAVKVGAWLLCGGFPDRPSGEDYHFGRLVENLPGDIAVTDAYTVFPLARISARTGLAAHGRRMEKICRAVENFYGGKSREVVVPDMQKQNQLFKQLSDLGRDGTLTAAKTLQLLREFSCDCSGLEAWIPGGLGRLMNNEMAMPQDSRNYGKIEEFMIIHLADRLPVKKITHLFKTVV